MRLLLAAFFVIGCTCGLVATYSTIGWLDRPTLPVVLVFAVSCMLIIFLNYYLFQPRIISLPELEKAGLIDAVPLRATKAFGIEDYNDEGPHYFVELKDGTVLYFVGQYLYDYEPISDDPEISQPRKFPCTEFTILRHNKQRHILNIQCGRVALEPEMIIDVKEPFHLLRRLLGHVPKDGEMISGLSYDSLKEMIQESSR